MREQMTTLSGRYRLLRKLGEGGFGEVYLAVDSRTDRFCAAKKLSEESGGCFRELWMMKKLRNPHLPQIYDVLDEGESCWMIMEYIRGIRFDSYLEGDRTLPELQTLETAIQLSEVLCYLQKQEPPVFHLDIKPGNLIRARDGTVRLIDFGAAFSRPLPMANAGTIGYAAPEQYEKNAAKDARTDIYGVGATIYRLVSGKMYRKNLSGSRVPGCGEAFSEVILKCLREQPEGRFQSAGQLRSALVAVRRCYGREKTKKQLLSALAFMLPAAALCVTVFPDTLNVSKDEGWSVTKLLEEAKVSTKGESQDIYRKAAFMEPGNPEVYLQYLQDAGRDGVFSESEELFLREILHTVPLGSQDTNEDSLRMNLEAYGKTAAEIGRMYLYEYSGTDASRIAGGWFAKAVEAGEEMMNERSREKSAKRRTSEEEGWLKEARYCLKMLSVEEMDGAGQERATVRILDWWEGLKEGKEFLGQDQNSLLHLHRIRDTIWKIAFRIADLRKAGIETGQIREEIRDRIRRADQLSPGTGDSEDSDRKEAVRKIYDQIREAEQTALLRLEGWETEV
ncbi:MAG: serine/threonine-protein kinase [Lachnospiraceae bacterium]|nr:serine/threonine-protein kinase [Lachnospiraceae bacterium]